MLGIRHSGGTSGGENNYFCCQFASTLQPAAIVSVRNTTTTNPGTIVAAASSKTTPNNINLIHNISILKSFKKPERHSKERCNTIKYLLPSLQCSSVPLIITYLILIALNQNSESHSLCPPHNGQRYLKQLLTKVLKRTEHKSISHKTSISIPKIPRKSAATNPSSSSRNYYLNSNRKNIRAPSTSCNSLAFGSGSSGSGAGGTSGAPPASTSCNGGSNNSNYHQYSPANSNSNNSTPPTTAMMMTKQKATMADRLNIGSEVRELKLGGTFNSKNTTTAFHTIKYDFKPASVDVNKVADVDIGSNNQVTVTVPNLESSGVPNTVYKGNHKKYTKECLIIYDKKTGDMTLEKLNHNIQVKKTRSEMTNKTVGAAPKIENSTMRVSSKTKVSTGSRKNNIIGYIPRNSPMQQGSSPSTAPVHKSPQSAPAWNANNAQATLPSIPMIIDDDDGGRMFQNATSAGNSGSSNANSANLSSSSASSHNSSADFHVPQQQQQKPTKNSSHYNQQKHPNQRQQQQWHQQLQQSQPNTSQQQYHNQNNRMYHNSNSSNSNITGASVNSNNSNNIRPSSSNSNINVDQTASQLLAGPTAELEQEIGVLSSSDSSTDTDSSCSDSGSDSDDSNEEYPQNSQPQHAIQHQLPNLQATISPQRQQQSSGYANGGFANVLHDDLQLSESNSSDSSDDDDL